MANYLTAENCELRWLDMVVHEVVGLAEGGRDLGLGIEAGIEGGLDLGLAVEVGDEGGSEVNQASILGLILGLGLGLGLLLLKRSLGPGGIGLILEIDLIVEIEGGRFQ